MKRLRPGLALCAALLLAVPGGARAQVIIPSVDDMVRALASESTGPMVRSMSTSGALTMSARQQIPAALDFAHLDLQVEFDANSHLLTTNGMTTLRALAVALLDPRLEGSRFQIGGHMIQGTGLNAMPVSSRRAMAVVEHLTTFYDIAPDRLVPVGYGNTKMVDPTTPTNSINERIEVINIDALN